MRAFSLTKLTQTNYEQKTISTNFKIRQKETSKINPRIGGGSCINGNIKKK